MDFVWATLLVLASMVCWMLNLVGLPGNWLLLLASVLYAGFGPLNGRLEMGWGVVAALGTLAVIGELVELAAGAVGAKKAGGSKRGAALALGGSMVGGIVGVFVGTPVPVVGPLVAAVLFAGLGALLGAVAGERWKGRDLNESMRIGEAAFWARLLGTLGKTLIGGVMLILVVAAVIARQI